MTWGWVVTSFQRTPDRSSGQALESKRAAPPVYMKIEDSPIMSVGYSPRSQAPAWERGGSPTGCHSGESRNRGSFQRRYPPRLLRRYLCYGFCSGFAWVTASWESKLELLHSCVPKLELGNKVGGGAWEQGGRPLLVRPLGHDVRKVHASPTPIGPRLGLLQVAHRGSGALAAMNGQAPRKTS